MRWLLWILLAKSFSFSHANTENSGVGAIWSNFLSLVGTLTAGKQVKDKSHVVEVNVQQLPETPEQSKDTLTMSDMLSVLEILETDPDNLDANRKMGAYLMEKPDLAEKFLIHAAVLSDWKDMPTMINLAECQRMLANLEAAESVAFKGLAASKDTDDNNSTASFTFLLGAIALDKKNYTDASEWYLAAAILQPWNVFAWLKASTLQFPLSQVNIVFAENVLIEAYKHLPEEPAVLYYLGLVLQKTDRPEQAIPFLETSLSLDASNTDALSALALSYHTLDHEAAYNTYAEYIRRVPSNPNMLTNFAHYLFDKERYDECSVLVREALKINPELKAAQSLRMQLNQFYASKKH